MHFLSHAIEADGQRRQGGEFVSDHPIDVFDEGFLAHLSGVAHKALEDLHLHGWNHHQEIPIIGDFHLVGVFFVLVGHGVHPIEQFLAHAYQQLVHTLKVLSVAHLQHLRDPRGKGGKRRQYLGYLGIGLLCLDVRHSVVGIGCNAQQERQSRVVEAPHEVEIEVEVESFFVRARRGHCCPVTVQEACGGEGEASAAGGWYRQRRCTWAGYIGRCVDAAQIVGKLHHHGFTIRNLKLSQYGQHRNRRDTIGVREGTGVVCSRRGGGSEGKLVVFVTPGSVAVNATVHRKKAFFPPTGATAKNGARHG
mmetsp:Transcript_6912/g.11680  ORF Transcript_6912/g.11680 Transcript_6912/m.11680 type:complete len:307 (+) Transcript_6912:331-1251(+)